MCSGRNRQCAESTLSLDESIRDIFYTHIGPHLPINSIHRLCSTSEYAYQNEIVLT